MNLITALEANRISEIRKNWIVFLNTEKALVENHFEWLDLKIHHQNKVLLGNGTLNFKNKSYGINFSIPHFHYSTDS